ncbi:MAG TPA: alpha-N-acetylglucosaminidase TIM-barrel domain-containing protein [Fimbriimonadaceae bacterium]|nr:alpha-N-acetylglucosaminidase TIM-barrel domain-containing protein [Fimbriimonadaceae bacterium]
MRFLVGLALLAGAAGASADQASAAAGVLHRLLGRRADAFHFSLIAKQQGLDEFRVSASGGTIQVEGSSGAALTRGAYTYLKEACHCLVTWDGDQLALPAKLPDFPATTVVCPNVFRHYFNVCTFGYSTPFWDWRRWEREIDWMALHGINMPLAMTGQERVWENVLMKYGVSDLHCLDFFTGPAFLPWHWMGNLDGHGGPMPQDYVDRSADLQKRILGRERELGMTPVIPGFSGFVPKEFGEIYPRAKVLTASGWAGFPPTYQLDARDPMFAAIQKRFVEAYTKQYGSDHLYLCDLYNEMKPTVNPTRKLQDLSETSNAIYASLHAADSQAVWVMQGWLFHNDPGFWKEPETAAFLGGVPDDRMVLLDLAGDQAEIWRQSAAFRRKRYIWNLLHGFGGATPLFGDLELVAQRPIAAVTDSRRGGFAGMGLTMEGINENAAVYELMCDTMWRDTPVDPVAWMRAYLASRYGTTEAVAAPTADGIRTSFYTKNEGGDGTPHYQSRPGAKVVPGPSTRKAEFRALVEQMLALPEEVHKQPLFRRDLIDVAKRYSAEVIDDRILESIAAAKKHEPEEAAIQKRFDDLMLDLDALLDTAPQYRLSNWISDARHAAGNGEVMENGARLQVTVWGGKELFDYAAKEWSGLVGDFYRVRWDRFFDALGHDLFNEDGFRSASAEWELQWCNRTSLPRIPKVDPIEQVRKILAETK